MYIISFHRIEHQILITTYIFLDFVVENQVVGIVERYSHRTMDDQSLSFLTIYQITALLHEVCNRMLPSSLFLA